MQDALLEEVKDMRWGQFKSALADAIVAHLEPIQQKYHEVIADKAYLDQVLLCCSALCTTCTFCCLTFNSVCTHSATPRYIQHVCL